MSFILDTIRNFLSPQPVEPTWGVVEKGFLFFDQTEGNIAGIEREPCGNKFEPFITLNKNTVIFKPDFILSEEYEISDITVSQEKGMSEIFRIAITVSKVLHTWTVNTSNPIKIPGKIAYLAKQKS